MDRYGKMWNFKYIVSKGAYCPVINFNKLNINTYLYLYIIYLGIQDFHYQDQLVNNYIITKFKFVWLYSNNF